MSTHASPCSVGRQDLGEYHPPAGCQVFTFSNRRDQGFLEKWLDLMPDRKWDKVSPEQTSSALPRPRRLVLPPGDSMSHLPGAAWPTG